MKRRNINHNILLLIRENKSLLRVNRGSSGSENTALNAPLPTSLSVSLFLIQDVRRSHARSFAVSDHPRDVGVLVQYVVQIFYKVIVVSPNHSAFATADEVSYAVLWCRRDGCIADSVVQCALVDSAVV